jgi:hypothetical protein
MDCWVWEAARLERQLKGAGRIAERRYNVVLFIQEKSAERAHQAI